MSTFSRYVLRVFFVQMALLLISFTALLQVFDLLSNSVTVINHGDGTFSSLALYAVLRLPEIVSFLTPFVVLIATMMTLGRMERDNEILAFKASGAPYNAVLLSFLPAVLLVGVAHFLLADQVVPRAINAMVARDIYVDRGSKSGDSALSAAISAWNCAVVRAVRASIGSPLARAASMIRSSMSVMLRA